MQPFLKSPLTLIEMNERENYAYTLSRRRKKSVWERLLFQKRRLHQKAVRQKLLLVLGRTIER